MEVNKIRNPITGRLITVGGPTYQKLIKAGYQLDNLPTHQAKKASRQHEDTSITNLSLVYHLPVGYRVESHSGRGSATRGWSKVKPHKRSDRIKMYQKCGDACFLQPSTLGFPICPNGKCEIDQRGVNAAYIRAKQWKYENVARKAQEIKDYLTR